MSQTTASRVPIGPCQLYWNAVRLGRPKSMATIRYTKDTVAGKAEDTGSDIILRKTGETCEVDVVVADLKPSQLQYVYDSASQWGSNSTVDPIARTATVTLSGFIFMESHLMSGTSNATVDRTGWTSGTVKVFSSDWETQYTDSTDYTSDNSAGTIAREAGGSISDNDVVHIQYTQSAAADVVYVGGKLVDFEAELKVVHDLENGKALMFHAWRAKKIGASDVAIQMAAEFGGVPMTFKLLADESRNPVQQLFLWGVEA